MYLDKNDLTKGIRPEVLDTLTRSNAEVWRKFLQKTESGRDAGVRVAEFFVEEACAEVAGYLSARYDIALELEKQPSDGSRKPLVVKLVRDIALFNIYNFSSPVNMPETKQRAYECAIALLRDVQKEKAAIAGLKRLNSSSEGKTESSYIAFGGNPKRQNHI